MLKGLKVKFFDESFSSLAKVVTPSIKFTEDPCSDEVLNIAKEFINDPAGDYKYLGELEQGKHFVEYMFTDDCGDVVLCVGAPQCLVVTDGKCRFADNDECVLAMRHISAKKGYRYGKRKQRWSAC